MMGRSTISAPGIEAGRLRATASRRRRFLLIAVLLSVGVHLIAALLIVFLPRVLPREAGPQEQGTVELLMVEKKGAQPTQAGQPKDSKPAQVPPEKAETPKTDAPKPEVQKDETPAREPKVVPAPPVTAPGDEPVPPPTEQTPPKPAMADSRPAPKPTEAQPMPPQTQGAPVFDLEGTDSDSNAIVMGGHVLPAMPDDRFRNRPPVYPIEAQVRNEHGSVMVLIHVAANGLATGADVVESSGVQILDEAALTAVRRWHFRPAMKEGQAVPFDYPFRFVFEPY
jgi:periplasmic protein TonB